MNCLFYPFHLCHKETLFRLLDEFDQVHFRDFMALQLTPLVGTTAFPDRMGDSFPDLVDAGKIVQGYNVSGTMSEELIEAVDRDLQDPRWRRIFHEVLIDDSRFQRGLFPVHQLEEFSRLGLWDSSGCWVFKDSYWIGCHFQVNIIQRLTRQPVLGSMHFRFEYGFALLKTAAALHHTIDLCHREDLIAVTDSDAHYHLLTRTCEREKIDLKNNLLKRQGY